MRAPLAAALALLVSSSSLADGGAPSVASDGRARGWVTSLGVGLVGLGFAGLGVGLGSMMTAGDANQLITAYYPANDPNAAPTAAEAPMVTQLTRRRDDATTVGLVSLIAGGALLAGGVACVLLDGAGGPQLQAAFVPAPGGGALVFSGRF